jgi:NAD(P)-dependent dehydrogenase (short-subunit alcohol dehydrogenase family)
MKTFLSIGSGPGMGLATAERFAREGFQIILSARNATKTQELAHQLNAKGLKAEALTVDTADPSSVALLIADVEKRFGSIEVLHYNAASIRKATLEEQPRDAFNIDLAVNVGGALVAAQSVAPKMSERGTGTILVTGGALALEPNPDYLSLSIGKAGIRAMVHALFQRFKEKGIHVATVTVAVAVSPASRNAEAVAENFWQLHSQPKGSWTAEIKYPA